MTSTAKTPEEYMASLPDERRDAMRKLYDTISKSLPKGFAEGMSYGMLTWVVPHSKYPAGYHCDPKQALPFVSLASQKNFIAVYHMGMYAMPDMLKWFTEEFPKHSKKKVDMGKSCLRFKNPDEIPYKLIGELMKKITPDKWIEVYEKNLRTSPRPSSAKQ